MAFIGSTIGGSGEDTKSGDDKGDTATVDDKVHHKLLLASAPPS